MQITIDTTVPLTEQDVAVLTLLLGDGVWPPAQPDKTDYDKAVDHRMEEAGKGATTGNRRAPRKAAEKAPESPSPASAPSAGSPSAASADEAGEEDLVGSDEPTLADAIDAATALMSQGKPKVIKDALAEIGVKKVSELKKPADIKRFMDLLP